MNTPAWQDEHHDLRTVEALRALYPEPQRPAAAATLLKPANLSQIDTLNGASVGTTTQLQGG